MAVPLSKRGYFHSIQNCYPSLLTIFDSSPFRRTDKNDFLLDGQPLVMNYFVIAHGKSA